MKVQLRMLTVAALSLGAVALAGGGCGGECEYDGDCGGFSGQCVLGFCEYPEPVDLTVKCNAQGEMCHAYEPGCTIPRDDKLGCPQPRGRNGDACRTATDCAEGYTCLLDNPVEGTCYTDVLSTPPKSSP